jgi:hypothetical protein
MIFYPNPVRAGTDAVGSLGDGYTVNIKWFQAEHSHPTNKIAYHIYYSTVKEDVFTDGVKYVSIDGSLQDNIVDLIPGQMYFFAVRPVEYDPVQFPLSNLQIAYNNLRVYPQSLLRSNIGFTDLIIPLLDVTGFPSTGVIKVGVELILYSAVDSFNNNLIVYGGNSPQNSKLVDQGGGHFYLPAAGNTGNGTINGLTLTSSTAVTQTWTIRCVQADGPAQAVFIATGSVSGTSLDIHGNQITWVANGTTVDNGTFSFNIVDGGTGFKLGDSFVIKVTGPVPGFNGRGYNNTVALPHNVNGSDGYNTWNPAVFLFTIGESNQWDRIFACQSRFEYPHYAFTMIDGYHQVLKDLLSTDLSAADAANVQFPEYDFAGYHRTDPVQLLNGTCVGSYIGGEMGCIDGYGNYNILRGFSLQDQNTQRQDVLLSLTGRVAVLIRRVQTGITCSCYLPSSEYQDDRCPLCYGTKFVFGYEQYFNPRSSDGRIEVRVGPTEENLKMYEGGLESEFPLDCWTLTVPTIKTRDVLVLFDQDDNEEFRYEVAGVTRNNTINGLDGGQHFRVFRVRKFDPIYQIRIFRNTSDFPQQLNTSIGFVPGIPPHTHTIVVNEKVLSVGQINQTTGVSQGHNHPIVNGEVMEVLGHTHTIIL